MSAAEFTKIVPVNKFQMIASASLLRKILPLKLKVGERSSNDKKKSALCGADLLDTNLDIDSKKYPIVIQR